ncbi:MAG: hypothetical protein ACRDIY_04890 [Chloroflexota bacterium]
MRPDVSSASPTDANHLLHWLEEQRQNDHERLTQLARVVAQLLDDVRDQGAAVAHLTEVGGRLADDGSADAITQLSDLISTIERSVDEHFDAQARADQVDGAQRDRELRQLADLFQRVEGLGRGADAISGRLAALAEELRHERDARPPIAQALDEIQRAQASVQNRLTIADEANRRFSGFQSIAEQAVERQRNEFVRVDSQQKLLDLRLTRELSDVRQAIEDWMRRGEERMKPLAELIRQIAATTDRTEITAQRVASVGRDLDVVNQEIGRIDAQAKIDRATQKRSAEAIEAQSQRIDEAYASLWHLNERITNVATSLEGLRTDVEAATQRIDEAERRIGRLDDGRQRLDAALTEVGSAIHLGQRDSRDQSGSLRSHVDSEFVALRAEIAELRAVATDRLRRTVDELQQQLREMESESA